MKEEEIVLANIRQRRSIFPISFVNQEIDQEVLKELLVYASYAPNHKNTQPWRFIVFKGKGLEKLAYQMAESYKSNTPSTQFLQKKYDDIQEKILRSAAIVVINIHYSRMLPKWEEIAAIGCAIQNLWLAAHAKGIGGYWSSPATITTLHDFLELGEDEECLGLFYLGYHHEPAKTPSRQPIEEKTKWVFE